MKVLIIANIRKQQGGITTQVLELCDSLRTEGLEVELASTHGSVSKRVRGIFDAYRKGRESELIIGVGCAYFGVFPMIAASVISGLLKKRVIYNFHDGQVYAFLNKYHGMLKLFFRKNAIIVATEYLNESFVRYGFNSFVIGNHLNEQMATADIHKEKNGVTKFIWARSYEKLYRADIMLDAAVEILKKHDVEFHMYGGGSLEKYYRELYERKGIIFHGHTKRETLLTDYGKYDVFVNTSDYDNFPMSIVEAGMSNLLIVTSRAGGINSIYTDDEVIFFERGSTEDLINKLELIIGNAGKYLSIKENLRKKVSGFTWDSVKEKWLAIIRGNNLQEIV